MTRKIVKSKYHFEPDLIETIGEVSTDEIKPWGSNDELKVIGKPASRIDGAAKVSGEAVYTSDVILPNMAYAKILRSPHPNARIKSIDISKAEELDGVLYVLTHKNSPEIKWYYNTSFLFDPNVRYQGDEVVCVTAETEKIAEDALRLIEVEYETLPFVTDAVKALKDDSPKVHDWGNLPRNNPDKYSRGDIQKGLQEADVIIEDTFTTQVVVHNTTEPHCSAAKWEGSKLTVWDSTQAIFNVRDSIAASLQMPASRVRVIKKYMGGGFGSKLEAGKYSVIAALISRKIKRPVKIVLDRREENLAAGNRPNSIQTLKAGVKKDGTLTALYHHSIGSIGAYPDGAGCSWPLRTIYKCENVATEEYSVFTNTGKSRAYRAPGHVQGTFGLESLIDIAAEKIGMDPLEFRLKNYADKDQVYNLPYTSKKLKEAYEKGAEAIGWHRRNKIPGSANGIIKRGIGMATQIWWGGGGPPAYATLKLNRDSSVTVLAGTQDLGTGTYTFIAQVASEVLELPIEKINVTIGDTETCPYCGASGGSTTAASVAPAVRDAAEQMKAKLLSGAAAILETPEDKLIYNEGVISVKDDSSKNISINDIVTKMRERVLVTTGARSANPQGYMINTFGAQFAEVEVDTLTGKVKVIKIIAAHDIGRVLNPKTLENQFHGGIIQGLGYALMEERKVDANTGKVLTTNLYSYLIPTIMDTPEIEVIIVSEGDSLISSVGVKGVGEPAIIPSAAAIANAVYNAIGVRIKTLPITPDKVLNALTSIEK